MKWGNAHGAKGLCCSYDELDEESSACQMTTTERRTVTIMKEIPPVYPAFLRKYCPEKLSSETESVVKGQIQTGKEKVSMNAQAERLQESRMREIRTSGLRRGSSGSRKTKAALYSIISM